jgi:hypothetical protein
VVAGLVAGFEGLFIDTLGEVEELLEVGVAGTGGETVGSDRNGLALAGPFSLGLRRHISLGLGHSVAGHHLQVLRDSDLSRGLAEVVVSAEAHDRNRLVVGSIGGVERSRNPVDGQIVRVLGVGATLLELGAGLGVDGDGIRAEERVQVRLAMLAGEHNRVDVLEHEGRSGIDLSVSLGGTH